MPSPAAADAAAAAELKGRAWPANQATPCSVLNPQYRTTQSPLARRISNLDLPAPVARRSRSSSAVAIESSSALPPR